MAAKPEDEAREIMNVIDRYFPKIFVGKQSILWLKQYTTQGGQIEWAAIFFEEYSRPLLTNFLGGWEGVRIIKGSRIDYQRDFNWDLKVHSVRDSNGKEISSVILNDKDAMERIIDQESGLGFIIADVEFGFDKKDVLKKWKDKIENRTKPHSKNTRTMKRIGYVLDLHAVFIKDIPTLKKALKDGWISIFKQGKQPSGTPRKPKYMMNLEKIPEDCWILK